METYRSMRSPRKIPKKGCIDCYGKLPTGWKERWKPVYRLCNDCRILRLREDWDHLVGIARVLTWETVLLSE